MTIHKVAGWKVCESPEAVPPKQVKKIRKACPIPEDEDLLWVAWEDRFAVTRIVVLTSQRIVSIWDKAIEQNLLSQLSGVEKSSKGAVLALSAGNQSQIIRNAPAYVAQRAYVVLSHAWNAVQRGATVSPLPAPEQQPSRILAIMGATVIGTAAVTVVAGLSATPRTNSPNPVQIQAVQAAPVNHEVLKKWDIKLTSGATGKGYRILVDKKTSKEDALALGKWFQSTHQGQVLNAEIFNNRRVLERHIRTHDVPIKLLKKHWLVQANAGQVRWMPTFFQ
ncbi:MAG: hypothetical protein AAFU77_01875 [Myxococcota bacterium]